MAYFHLLADPHMNYTLNRPLADGEATARIAEAKALAPKIQDINTWTATFLEAANYFAGFLGAHPARRQQRRLRIPK